MTTLDRARQAAAVLDPDGCGHREACAVTGALSALAHAEAAQRSADALERIADSLALIAAAQR